MPHIVSFMKRPGWKSKRRLHSVDGSTIRGIGAGTYRTGASFRVSALAHAGGSFLVSLDAATASLLGETARYAVDGLSIEGPRVSTSRAVLTVAPEPGQALLVPVGSPSGEDGSTEHLLVEVKRLER